MLTESEAKTKWCPFARVIGGQMFSGIMHPAEPFYPHNRVQERDAVPNEATWHQAHHCIASACMAWRWSERNERVQYDYIEVARLANEINPPFSNCPPGYEVSSYGSGYQYTAKKEVGRDAPSGFCGLAGTP